MLALNSFIRISNQVDWIELIGFSEPAEEVVVEAEKVEASAEASAESSLEEESVNVTCHIRGVYPRPHIELIQGDGLHGQRSVLFNIN